MVIIQLMEKFRKNSVATENHDWELCFYMFLIIINTSSATELNIPLIVIAPLFTRHFSIHSSSQRWMEKEEFYDSALLAVKLPLELLLLPTLVDLLLTD